MKDSRSITKEDCDQLVDEITNLGLVHNIVTHGTYTIGNTARYLFEKGIGSDKVVIVTGSMEPILGSIDDQGHLAPSDAQFNLGYSAAEAFHLENGIYVSMNGDVFKQPDEFWIHDENGVRWTSK